MINSIRKYILIYLGFSIGTFASMLILLSNLYFDQRDIQKHLDSVMTISALTLELTIDKLDEKDIKDTQSKFNQFDKLIHSHTKHIQLPHFSADEYTNNFNFQVLDKDGNQLISSPSGPKLPKDIINTTGFKNLTLNEVSWRFFISKHPNLNIYIVLGEQLSYRYKLVTQITRDDLLILLLIFPVSGILIWITVSKSLTPLKQIVNEIKTRDPFNLKPMEYANTPEEIHPIIAEINQLLHRLKEGLSREQAFAGDAAHELRTPLAIIKTLAQTAVDSQHPMEMDQVLNKIIVNVDRGSHVVEQLMNMSKTMPEAIQISDFVLIDLEYLTRDTITTLLPEALEKNMDFELEVESGLPQILGNKIALEILIRNLIDNSIRYSYKNTCIFVNLYQSQNHIILEVRDQGPGIPASKQAKVFDRFYRAHDPQYQGSGLGLAIVKQIANLHQAQINLESTRTNTGVIIRVFFPIAHQ
jgi:two-component system sensor histidine kinase QseC